MFDSAYSQLLDTNQELRSELQDEIFINKSNEKKIRSLVKELEQCYKTKVYRLYGALHQDLSQFAVGSFSR